MKKFLLFIMALPFMVMAQNDCASAVEITLNGITTVGAIDGTADNACQWQTAATAGEWYKYTSTSNGYLTLNTDLAQNDGTAGSDDTRVSVYTGDCTMLECYAASDDVSQTNYLTNITFAVEPGVTYYILWDDRWSSLGFDFESTLIVADCAPVTSYPYSDNLTNWNPNFACYTVENIDAATGEFNANFGVNDVDGDTVGDDIITIFPGSQTGDVKDDWVISKAFTLTSGTEYTFEVKYNSFALTADPASDNIELVILDEAASTAANQSVIYSQSTFSPATTTVADLYSTAYTASGSFIPTAAGDYYLGIHFSSDSPNASVIMLFEVNVDQVLDVDDIDSDHGVSMVYPNPVKTIMNVSLSSQFDASKTNITLTDMNGKQVFSGAYTSLMDVSHLNSGVYIMTITDGVNTENQKLIKE